MATRVTTFNATKGIEIGMPYLVKLFERGAPGERRLRATYLRSVKDTYEQHATNAIRQVGTKLLAGAFPNPETSLVPTISAQDGDGRPVTVPGLSSWNRLEAGYIRRKPRSTSFWFKRGWIQQGYQAQATRPLTVSVTDTNERVRSHHANRIRKAYTIDVTSPHHKAIRDLVLTPFVSAGTVFPGKLPGSITPSFRNSLQALALPELGAYKRPFVAQLSATLGRRALTALRRL